MSAKIGLIALISLAIGFVAGDFYFGNKTEGSYSKEKIQHKIEQKADAIPKTSAELKELAHELGEW